MCLWNQSIYHLSFFWNYRYKSTFERLKGLKTEIDHLQHLHQRSKIKLQKEFQDWWTQEAASLQVSLFNCIELKVNTASDTQTYEHCRLQRADSAQTFLRSCAAHIINVMQQQHLTSRLSWRRCLDLVNRKYERYIRTHQQLCSIAWSLNLSRGNDLSFTLTWDVLVWVFSLTLRSSVLYLGLAVVNKQAFNIQWKHQRWCSV